MQARKISVPVIITVIVILALLAYFVFFVFVGAPPAMKIILGIVILALIGVAIYVLIERIREIRSGETDDLSKY